MQYKEFADLWNERTSANPSGLYRFSISISFSTISRAPYREFSPRGNLYTFTAIGHVIKSAASEHSYTVLTRP